MEPERQNIPQGSSVEIRCDATGSPTPTIKWTKVGEPLSPNTQQHGSVLILQNVQMQDRGVYVCVATNNLGIAQGSSMIEVERT